MRWSPKFFGTVLAGLAASSAVLLVAGEVNKPESVVGRSLQTVFKRAGWETESSSASEWASGAIGLEEPALAKMPDEPVVLPEGVSFYFGAIAGGGAPDYNEIALEKNLGYFQRSLLEMGFLPALTNLFFANGNDGQKTVRYLDERDRERYKAPAVPNLSGRASYDNAKGWFEALAQTDKPCPAFFYFTGHGTLNYENEDNNALILWEEALVSVQELAGWLAPLPDDQPFVTMMAQCYSGSFANLIYENGDPEQPVALQSRCGFFATVASRPSVGCTPAVNEADYKDYSSSFFAGLTGRDRAGNAVSSADYNNDSKISYAEAHAFAKVDEETTDWPISTVEAWLQKQVSEREIEGILLQPIDDWWVLGRQEQQYVIWGLLEKTSFDSKLSYAENKELWPTTQPNSVKEAYQMRLQMELINIAAEALLRDQQDPNAIAILDQIIECEAGSWQ